jgi:Protein of unknown function (DUF3149)
MWINPVAGTLGSNVGCIAPIVGGRMKAIVDLFSTDYGLFSIGVITFTIGMAWWFSRFFARKMRESEQNSSR